jgi:hypothetical protein
MGAEGTQPAPVAAAFTREELEKLLAPVALYPDDLLAQVLPASAYPVQIVMVQRWLDKNASAIANNDYSGIDKQNWDPAVKALARFPDVIKKMSADLDWTTDLGDAVVNQPKDVADVVQLLRAKAESAGKLKTTKEQKVVKRKEDGRDVIVVESADPSVVYVPTYDPVEAYDPLAGRAILAGARHIRDGDLGNPCGRAVSVASEVWVASAARDVLAALADPV